MLDLLLTGLIAFAAGSILSSSKNREQLKNHLKEPPTRIVSSSRPEKVIKSNTFSQIGDYHREITDIQQRIDRDRLSRDRDREIIHELEGKINRLYQEYETKKGTTLIQNIAQDSTIFDISEENAHLIQFHVGEIVFNKKCPTCQSSMILQFPNKIGLISPTDFFWACSAWYSKRCSFTEPFKMQDAALLSKKYPEFYTTQKDLNTITHHPSTQKVIGTRVKNHINEQMEDYICPIHKTPLILREKRANTGLMDAFFLGCSQWREGGCSYVLKLKSPAQLAAFLEKSEGRGIL